MQSSTVLAFRALIMLACMIVVPVLAICGTSWTKALGWGSKPAVPESAVKVLKAPRQGVERPAAGTQSAAGRRSNSPPLWNAENQPQGIAPAVAFASPQAVSPPAAAYLPPGTADSYPASFESPAQGHGGPSPTTSPRAVIRRVTEVSGMPGDAGTPANRDGGNIPAGYVAPVPAPPSETTNPGADWFTWTQQRLRDLGATYYLLETWGRNGELYRFHCNMAIAGNPDYTRHFEATDASAGKAMRAVLEQVEAWRYGRQP
jgi:hypothetical protein